MKRSLGFLLIATVVGAGVWRLSGRVSCVATPSDDRVVLAGAPARGAAVWESSELAQLRQEVVELKYQLGTMTQRLAATDPAPVDGQGPAVRDPRADPEARDEEQRRRQEYLAGVEAAFRRETPGTSWSSATSSIVEAAFGTDNDLRQNVRGVECRSHTCRVEIVDDGSGRPGKAIGMFARRVARELPGVTVSRSEGAGDAATMVLYMSGPDRTSTTAQ